MRYMKTLMIVFLMLSICVAPVFAASSPKAQVQETVDQVLQVLREGKLQGQQRRETLSRLIRARFDFVIMSQRTLGKYWRTASAAEQDRFVKLFSDLLEASYIGRIEAYNNETVSYLAEKIEEDRAEVMTVVRNGSTDIPIDYRLVQRGDGWFVYDVAVEEISLIKNYRSSYGEIVRKEGFKGLFARMEEKVRELRQAPGASGQ